MKFTKSITFESELFELVDAKAKKEKRKISNTVMVILSEYFSNKKK